MRTTSPWRAILTLSALGFWALGTVPAAGQGEAEALSASFRKAARRVLPAVVTVRPLGIPNPFEAMPGGPLRPGPRGLVPDLPRGEAGGSGVVIDAEKGFVLTNDHLVQNASRVVVILQDGRERSVSQVRRDPKTDLALLVVDGKGLAQADWGDSEALDTGDWVLAVGQPFGLSNTVTAGIVSGKGRGIGMAMYEDLIQTDAAINPGNSGGPLVNLKGEVVGINMAIGTAGGDYEGLGFAIPAARARRVAADLAEHGRVRRAYLGIQIGILDRETLERVDQPGAVAVNGVSLESPAAEAGLRRGDILLRLDGKEIKGSGALQAAIEVAPVGQPLTLAIDRDGERREIKVVPRAQPETFGLPEPDRILPPDIGPRRLRDRLRGPIRPQPPEPPLQLPRVAPPQETALRTADVHFPTLGLRLSEPSPALARRFRIGGAPHGLLIVAVEPDGPADHGGLEPGMTITHVGAQRVETLDDLRNALSKRPEGRDLAIRILKGTKAEFRLIPETATPKPAEGSEPPADAGQKPNPEIR